MIENFNQTSPTDQRTPKQTLSMEKKIDHVIKLPSCLPVSAMVIHQLWGQIIHQQNKKTKDQHFCHKYHTLGNELHVIKN